MALLSHFEILGLELVQANEKAALLFEKIGWGQFFSALVAITWSLLNSCFEFERKRSTDWGFQVYH